MKKKLRGVTLLVAVLTLPLALSACTSAEQEALAQNTVVLAAQGEVPPMDPHRMTGTIGLRVSDAIFETLVREDLASESDGAAQILPALASDWSLSEDGRVYDFTIRSGVQFHDGTELDAAAVQLNFDRILDEESPVYSELAAANMSYLTRWIERTEATDADTVRVELNAPFPDFLRLLNDRRMGIIGPELLKQGDEAAIARSPIGTGPFMSEGGIEQGRNITLTRFDEYWRGPANVENLLFTSIADANTMVSALQTEQIDIILNAGAGQISQLERTPGVEVQYPAPANSYFIRLNTRAAGTDNVLVRQALNFAVDREGIAAATNDQTEPLTGAIPVGNSAWNDSVNDLYSYDPDRARELLAEADVTLPLRISIMAPSEGPGFSQSREVMTLLQQNFLDVGIELDVQFVEFTSMVAIEGPGYTQDVHGSFNGWTTGADSAYWLENMFSPDLLPPKGVNRGWYENPELRGLFASARAEQDENARSESYRAAGSIITSDAPWVFLYQDRLPRAFSERIEGISETPSVYVDYWQLSKLP